MPELREGDSMNEEPCTLRKGVKAENISHAGDLTVISGTFILYPG